MKNQTDNPKSIKTAGVSVRNSRIIFSLLVLEAHQSYPAFVNANREFAVLELE